MAVGEGKDYKIKCEALHLFLPFFIAIKDCIRDRFPVVNKATT